MGKTYRICLIAATISVCAACSPLRQASMVYSSQVVFGADISTPTPDSPSSSVSVGLKVKDVAYVPVAVSLPDSICANEGDSNKTDAPVPDICKIDLVKGGNESSVDAAERIALSAAMSRHKDALVKEETIQRTLAQKALDLQQLDAKVAGHRRTMETTKVQLSGFLSRERSAKDTAAEFESDPEKAGISSLEAYLSDQQSQVKDEVEQAKGEVADATAVSDDTARTAAQTAQFNAEARERELASIQQILANYKSALQGAAQDNAAREKAKGELPALQQDLEDAQTAKELAEIEARAAGSATAKALRSDALSVFGTFTSNTDAAKDEGTVGLGRVFATGVAAQHLAESETFSAKARCMEGVSAVVAALPEAERTKKAEELSRACR